MVDMVKLSVTDLHVTDDMTVDGDVTTNGAMVHLGTFTVGADDTGHDVKFFGATTGKSWLWDESADKMIVTGASDLLGATQVTGALTVGVDDTGHDVKFFGATAGRYAMWDESADTFDIAGDLKLTGITTGNVTALAKDGSGNILVASCATANIPSAAAGYAVGCILLITDGNSAATVIAVNSGTTASCTFSALA